MTQIAQPYERNGERGFTLLELVVTLGLLSLIVAAIMGGLGSSRRVWQMRSDLEQLSGLGAARSLLAARVSDAMPLWDRSNKGIAVPAFDGTSVILTFVAPLAHANGGGGLFRQVVRLVPSASHSGLWDLVVDESPFGGAGAAKTLAATVQTSVLVGNVAEMALRYIGSDATRSAPEWSASWQHRPQLPRLIGLTVVFPPGDLRRWPELMLAPRSGPAR